MKTKKSFLWLAFLILATIWILARHNQQANYYNIKGLVFGTVYNITYQYDSDLKPEIEAELKRFDFSLSPFNDSSVISRVNRNEELVTDSFFQKCFNRSMEISRETKGAFDITIAPLANAWGFGFKKVAITLRTSISANDNKWAAMLYENGESYFSKEYLMHIVDRVGGGDSFGGGLIYACLNDYAPQDTIEFAVAASCLKHSIEGDFNMVSVDEVKKLAGGDASGRVQR